MKKSIFAPLVTATAAAAALLVLSSGSAFAAGASSGSLDVQLSVTTGCDINGGGGIGAGTGAAALLNFGNRAPLAAAVTGSTPATAGTNALTVTCSGTQTPSLAFDGGSNAVGATRNLKTANPLAAVQTIAYTLGSAAATPANYTVNTPIAQTIFTAGQAKTVAIFGALTAAIPAGAEGQYTDTVTVNLTW
jgi:spore coat protein U-like protein